MINDMADILSILIYHLQKTPQFLNLPVAGHTDKIICRQVEMKAKNCHQLNTETNIYIYERMYIVFFTVHISIHATLPFICQCGKNRQHVTNVSFHVVQVQVVLCFFSNG